MRRYVLICILLTGATSLMADDLLIRSADEFVDFAQKVNGGDSFAGSTVRLANDINLEGLDWEPIGTEAKAFRGVFDGQGYWIHNLTVSVVGGTHAGLFGYIGEEGTVCRVGISSGVVRVKEKQFPDVGCYAGGIAAYSQGTISQCANMATIYGNQTQANVGGIVGELDTDAVVEDCYNLGRLYTSKGDESNDNYLGGIAGVSDGQIHRVYVENLIEGNTVVNSGGIVADEAFNSDVQNAYYQGNLSDDEYYYYEARSMKGFRLDGMLNARGDYSVWTFAEGRLPLLACLHEFLRGDVNLDGLVTIGDVTYLVNILLGKSPANFMADVNQDSEVSIADVTCLVNIILGK